MFTDRFIKVPISVYNMKNKELTGNEILEESWFKFLPYELIAYRPSYGVESIEPELVSIILRSGDITLVDLSVQEFEKILNDHQKYNNQ